MATASTATIRSPAATICRESSGLSPAATTTTAGNSPAAATSSPVPACCRSASGWAIRPRFGKVDPCSDVFVRLLALGRVLIGENLRDALWALQLLLSQGDVDPNRLACVGLSYGGRMTMLTAAMEPRIKSRRSPGRST